VFQYNKPQDAQARTAATPASGASAAAAPATAPEGATVGAVPDSSVTATPLSAPAPVSNSSNVHPGNPKAGTP
ncbi:BON domain-containing protein, partial [Burkholderia pseudomallei]